MQERIELEKEELPASFEIDFGTETFIMSLNYNKTYCFWTADIAQSDGTQLVLGERLRLGQTLFFDVTDDRLPLVPIVPISTDVGQSEITKENFYKTVFLFLEDGNPLNDPLMDLGDEENE